MHLKVNANMAKEGTSEGWSKKGQEENPTGETNSAQTDLNRKIGKKKRRERGKERRNKVLPSESCCSTVTL